MEEQKQLFQRMVGRWKGTCQTWFEPGKLADESEIEGVMTLLPQGPFLRHTYTGGMQGRPRTGEETITFNKASRKFEVAWFDDFHMNYGILYSLGNEEKKGNPPDFFSVTGSYSVGPEHPEWGWRTTFELIDDHHLTIIAYNIMPEGEEAKAVETVYKRI